MEFPEIYHRHRVKEYWNGLYVYHQLSLQCGQNLRFRDIAGYLWERDLSGCAYRWCAGS